MTAGTGGADTWRIAPVRVQGEWFSKAHFTHAKHKSEMTCESCHPATASKAAAASAKEAAQNLKLREAEVSKAAELIVGAEATADVKLRRDLAKVQAKLSAAKAEKALAAANTARDDFNLVSGRLGQWVESGSLTLQAHAPDPKGRFVATHAASAWRDDALTLSVVDGLLSTSESKSTGQAANIIVNLARSFAALGSGSDSTRELAVLLLGNESSGGSMDALRKAMEDRSINVRKSAVAALSDRGGKEALSSNRALAQPKSRWRSRPPTARSARPRRGG